mgnify:CR=1 FL=1
MSGAFSESFRWRFEDTSGQPLPSEHSVPFPTQADAEAWFTESWHRTKMVAAGVPDCAALLTRRQVSTP